MKTHQELLDYRLEPLGMDARVVNAERLWYMPGEELIKGMLMVGANMLTRLRDGLDPVIGGSTARCILRRIEKISFQPEQVAAEWARGDFGNCAVKLIQIEIGGPSSREYLQIDLNQ